VDGSTIETVERRKFASLTLLICVSSLRVASSFSHSVSQPARLSTDSSLGAEGTPDEGTEGAKSLSFSSTTCPARGGVAGAAQVGSGAQRGRGRWTTSPGEGAGTTKEVGFGERLGEETCRWTTAICTRAPGL